MHTFGTRISLKEIIKNLLQQLPPEIHGFWVPRGDRFKGEYIHAYDERLAYVSGFTGSAGVAIITRTQSALFIDGRYTLQAEKQSSLPLLPFNKDSIAKFLANMPGPIGFDPWLMTQSTYQQWQSSLQALSANPIDNIWQRPKPAVWDILDHPLQWAGISTQDKLAEHKWAKNEAFLICDPATLAWLCNIRAHVVPFTPVVPGWALVWRDDVYVWADANDTTKRLKIAPEKECFTFLQNLPEDTTVFFDPTQTPYAFVQTLKQTKPLANPYLIAKACKNVVEQKGMRDAHIRDGIAVTSFIKELKTDLKQRSITEKEAARMLLQQRQKQPHFRFPSFGTTSASGANGAIVHYHPDQSEDDIPLTGLYLVDSGGQYDDGTTDITRVIAIDPPTKEQIRRYTQVLRGHIALARAIFPRGTTGQQLDVLARQYLWQTGLDYAHGTGHGVGSCLSVHEGPQNISTRSSDTPLQIGMVVSNEPGYYKTGEYGIRLENLMMVIESQYKDFLCFETLTYVAFEEELIDRMQLTPEETMWLQDYQAKSL